MTARKAGTGSTTRAGADTVAELVRRRGGDHRTGPRDGHHALGHHRAAAAGATARAALLVDLMPPRPGGEPHPGLLLDNTPEYPLRPGAAALAG
ncbi:acyl-CoA synthetase, partial [Streptomyces roseolus]